MIERFITAAAADDPGAEDAAATRERLRELFPRGATRRMTQLGLLIGSVLRDLSPSEDDAVIYASSFAENQALEAYLASFPTPSPTLFQTSIHPSAVQQVLIARQLPVREVFPLAGRAELGTSALRLALGSAAANVIVCGGEERGSWLRDVGLASEAGFAFSLRLTASPHGAIGWVRDSVAPGAAGWDLLALWRIVAGRRSASGGGLEIGWQ